MPLNFFKDSRCLHLFVISQILERWVSPYWIIVAIGIFFAFSLALLRARDDRFCTSVKDVFITLLFIYVGARVGGVLFKVIGHIFLYSRTPDFWTLENWIMLLRSGGVFYGGLIGGGLFSLVFIRIRNINFRDIMDIIVPSIALFLVFGRVACFSAGCCFGREATWGIVMSDGVARIPVQLIESIFSLCIVVPMLLLRPERERRGVLLPMFLATYAVGRFLIEFMRGDMNRGVFILSTSQWISLVLLLSLGLFLIIMSKKKERKRNKDFSDLPS